ncbi:translation elongation factor aEF-2 [Vulcanisaeta moutnovskia 768-28]|uniref:Elongation factor 2 n=1 Tax=Vulcanisaeta moutnovskia (strain 768-28) TaxID=985053 RepID=F0QXI4_VULM7|nr:elongation factor EF-2 [Vulcanisaeta moutnovskia]ADY02399.1 translation elongation factor aEF-2 [Vulcanisaeta moutnovskia 768-28]
MAVRIIEKKIEDILSMMRNPAQVRNAGTLAHVDHGKTTTTDSLLMGAGLLSPKVAGKALAMDYVEIEQLRQMTVKSANISLYFEYEGKPYIINFVDTPGHVDFTGHVTRSLRVMDGALVVVDAVEGVMTQTETVVRQAMEEMVRPVLFINKIDRLIKELRLNPNEIQERIIEIVKDFNNLIDMYADPNFKDKWKVDPSKGQVALGSALNKWGVTIPQAAKAGLKFSNIVDAYEKNYVDELAQEFPLYRAILNMIVEHVPPPNVAQRYRIPKIWRGDINSPLGKALLEADPDGPTVIAVSKMNKDPHAGLIATGRVFSGTIREGDEVYLINAKTSKRVLQTYLYMGPNRIVIPEVPAGNIVALLGVDDARAGETIVASSIKDVAAPFERMKYISEPVVTVAIEPKNPNDLAKLVEGLKELTIEDPTLSLKIDEETGQILLSGVGTLHLEIATWLLKERTKLDFAVSQPLVRFREAVRTTSPTFEGKSPNKHNRLYISVEPLDEETIRLIQYGEVTDDQDPRERAKILREKAGWDTDEARGIWTVDEQYINVLVDKTTGIQYLREIRDYIVQGFRWSIQTGPLAQEPVRGIKVILHDAVVHEDPAHRGPAQIMPATKNAIMAGILAARPTLLEPVLSIEAKTTQENIGSVIGVLNRHRGKVIDMVQSEYMVTIKGEIPVIESFTLSDELRSATAGRVFWSLQFSRWSPVPENMLVDIVMKIRERKGLPKEIPKVEDFISQY